MKRRTIFIIFLALASLFFSCHKKQLQKKPPNLISYNKMVNIISDIYLIESAVNLTPPDSNRMTATFAYYDDLYLRYDITREQMIASLYYYLSDENQAEKMLGEAAEKLSEGITE